MISQRTSNAALQKLLLSAKIYSLKKLHRDYGLHLLIPESDEKNSPKMPCQPILQALKSGKWKTEAWKQKKKEPRETIFFLPLMFRPMYPLQKTEKVISLRQKSVRESGEKIFACSRSWSGVAVKSEFCSCFVIFLSCAIKCTLAEGGSLWLVGGEGKRFEGTFFLFVGHAVKSLKGI